MIKRMLNPGNRINPYLKGGIKNGTRYLSTQVT